MLQWEPGPDGWEAKFAEGGTAIIKAASRHPSTFGCTGLTAQSATMRQSSGDLKPDPPRSAI